MTSNHPSSSGISLGLSARRDKARTPQPSDHADMILFNGKIVTGDAAFRIVDAMAVRGEHLLAVGARDEVMAYRGAGTALVDLHGATVIPGLIDSHHHFTNRAARAFFGVRLDYYTSVRDLLAGIAEKVRDVGPGRLILSNAGNAVELLDELRAPTLEELDAVAPANPLILTLEDGLRVNSRMLERCGLTPETRVPDGGNIGRDPITGRLTGLVAGTAAQFVWQRAGDDGGSARVYSSRQLREALLWAQRQANAVGLTGIRHPASEVQEMRVLQSLWETGELTLRFAMDVGFEPHHQSPEALEASLQQWGVTQPFGDHWLRFNGVGELGIDQSTDGMLLSWPYASLPPAAKGDASYRGIMRVTQAELDRIIVAVHRSGWRPLVHAGGDVAVDMLLNSYEAIHRQDPLTHKRWVVDHAHFGQPRHIERIKSMNLLVYMQYHLYMYYPIFAGYHGAEAVSHLFPARQWLDAGVHVAAGSDYSKMPPNPFEGLYFFITRDTKKWGIKGPEHGVTREQALRMYTWNCAYGSFEEHLKGSLEAGKLADFVVLSDDYLTVPDRAIRDLKSLATVVGGDIVHAVEGKDLTWPDHLRR
jgi:predicted amidohydrolase YtcJ